MKGYKYIGLYLVGAALLSEIKFKDTCTGLFAIFGWLFFCAGLTYESYQLKQKKDE